MPVRAGRLVKHASQEQNIMWIYRQQSGELRHGGQLVGICYSGRGEGLNNPTMENVPDVGPIPKGSYTIGPFFYDPPISGDAGKGPFVTYLRPDRQNEMFGRDGFMIHGDNDELNHTASDGCIVASRTIREAIRDSNDSQLEVI
jgi:hypothetical protein